MNNTFLGLEANGWLAIVGGVYAGATLLLAWWTNVASLRSVAAARDIASDQINAAANGITDQIKASAEIQAKQLTAMREAALIQARASSISNNRQVWINSLRDEVTGFLTDADMIIIVRNDMAISDARWNEQFRIARALNAHIFKVRLLLNPTEGESTELIEMLDEVQREGITDERREGIVSHTQAILKTEWERVKSGE